MTASPTTPAMSRVTRALVAESDLDSSPQGSALYDISFDEDGNKITYEEAIQQIVALTEELREFEASSKELEDGMELELNELNEERSKLLQKLADKDNDLKQARRKIADMETELMGLMDKNKNLVVRLETEISMKTKKLIDVEILNDTFENKERITRSQLRSLEDNYNDLLEKYVLLQGEVTESSRELNNEKLVNSNTANLIEELRSQIKDLKTENDRLKVRQSKPGKLSAFKTPAVRPPVNDDDIDELNAAPVVPSAMQSIPRSSSMRQIQEMNSKVNNLSNKADHLRQRLEDVNPNNQVNKSGKARRSVTGPLKESKTTNVRTVSDVAHKGLTRHKSVKKESTGNRFFQAFKRL